MNFLNKLVVATIPAVPKPIVRLFASRYIAGEEVSDAVNVVRRLNREGILATLDVLGEDVYRREEAIASKDKILEVLRAIHTEHLDSNVSIKLTQLGLKLDKAFCLQLVREIVAQAKAFGNFVRIDMEDSGCTDDTLWVYRMVRKEFPDVGIVLQAYMRRTMDDAMKLMDEGMMNFRLCKGIYIEPAEIAFKGHDEINRNYVAVTRRMLDRKAYVGIATHDDDLISAAYDLIREKQLQKTEYEFQMLLGVRPELRTRLIRDGHKLRIYVPFGRHWYRYSIRRFKENPQVAGHVFKALFSRFNPN